MAPRPYWKGYLKLSLVNCPVAMTPAITSGERVRFHVLNRDTGNRVSSRYVDAQTGSPVGEDEQAKGYPRGEDDYVVIEEEEIESVALENARTIDIELFAPAGSIDWIWFDSPYYLSPDDPVGEEAFSVIREAMRATGTVGISRLVLHGRERAVMLEPRDKGIVLWTLRYGDEVRDSAPSFAPAEGSQAPAAALKLAQQLIEEKKKDWDRSLVIDPVQDRLLEIIAARRKGSKKPSAKAAEETSPPDNVVNIMDALRRSIASEGGSKKKAR
ncbi:MAG: Ku protein [Nitratireductor sp.]|jgi:DNA end-binding protein Ku|nr:Ku protein [Nitratireductor sp.]